MKPDDRCRCTNEKEAPLNKPHDVATPRVECTHAPEGKETPEEAYACRMASTTQRDNRNLDRALPRIPEWKVTNSWSVLQISPIRLKYATEAHTGQPGTEPGPSPECELSVAYWDRWNSVRAFSRNTGLGRRTTAFPSSNYQSSNPDRAWSSQKGCFLVQLLN